MPHFTTGNVLKNKLDLMFYSCSHKIDNSRCPNRANKLCCSEYDDSKPWVYKSCTQDILNDILDEANNNNEDVLAVARIPLAEINIVTNDGSCKMDIFDMLLFFQLKIACAIITQDMKAFINTASELKCSRLTRISERSKLSFLLYTHELH
jgi:hypothetical protein